MALPLTPLPKNTGEGNHMKLIFSFKLKGVFVKYSIFI
jgi:hypothetical protein